MRILQADAAAIVVNISRSTIADCRAKVRVRQGSSLGMGTRHRGKHPLVQHAYGHIAGEPYAKRLYALWSRLAGGAGMSC